MMSKLVYETNYTTGGIENLKVEGDDVHFRWVRGNFGILLGMNYLDSKEEKDGTTVLNYKYFNDLDVTVTREYCEDGIRESYEFVNRSKEDIDLSKDEYGVVISFADGSDIEKVASIRRAYCRVIKTPDFFCVYNSRFNGLEDGVGLCLISGKLGKYKATKYSNRSTTEHSLFLPEIVLKPEEKLSFAWELFYFADLQSFETKIRAAIQDRNEDSTEIKDLESAKDALSRQGLLLVEEEGRYKFYPQSKDKNEFDLDADRGETKTLVSTVKKNKRIILKGEVCDELKPVVLKRADKFLKGRTTLNELNVLSAYSFLCQAAKIEEKYSEYVRKYEPFVTAVTRCPDVFAK